MSLIAGYLKNKGLSDNFCGNLGAFYPQTTKKIKALNKFNLDEKNNFY